MPESPDFDHIARQVIQRVVAELPHYATNALNDAVAEQLRQIWNTRGAADIAELEGVLPLLAGVTVGTMKRLDAALRALDR